MQVCLIAKGFISFLIYIANRIVVLQRLFGYYFLVSCALSSDLLFLLLDIVYSVVILIDIVAGTV